MLDYLIYIILYYCSCLEKEVGELVVFNIINLLMVEIKVVLKVLLENLNKRYVFLILELLIRSNLNNKLYVFFVILIFFYLIFEIFVKRWWIDFLINCSKY